MAHKPLLTQDTAPKEADQPSCFCRDNNSYMRKLPRFGGAFLVVSSATSRACKCRSHTQSWRATETPQDKAVELCFTATKLGIFRQGQMPLARFVAQAYAHGGRASFVGTRFLPHFLLHLLFRNCQLVI